MSIQSEEDHGGRRCTIEGYKGRPRYYFGVYKVEAAAKEGLRQEVGAPDIQTAHAEGATNGIHQEGKEAKADFTEVMI